MGTRGVGGDVLEVNVALTLGDEPVTEAFLLLAHLGNNALKHGGGQAEVDEAGAGDLGGGDNAVLRKMVDNDLSDLAGGSS